MRYHGNSIKSLFMLSIAAWTVSAAGCAHTPPVAPPALTKVIVSDLGELTSNTCYPGEKLSYKIFYINNSARKATFTITDQLSSDLTGIVVFDGGRYNRALHNILWEIAGVSPGHGGYVAFEAIVTEKGTIENQAMQSR